MPQSLKLNGFLSAKSCGLILLLTSLTSLTNPVFSHTVKVVGDVAGMWHLEPNHNPKVGVPARTWVVLTQKGGKQVPLDQASCQMAVYAQPRKSGDRPVLQPTIKAIAAEKYQGIPGADITFPKVGRYELELGCTPKGQGNFKPFQMKYSVTVAQ
jgi:hypothetical protein